jgi:hypothetical protein
MFCIVRKLSEFSPQLPICHNMLCQALLRTLSLDASRRRAHIFGTLQAPKSEWVAVSDGSETYRFAEFRDSRIRNFGGGQIGLTQSTRLRQTGNNMNKLELSVGVASGSAEGTIAIVALVTVVCVFCTTVLMRRLRQ